jgi:hypothetical protein
MAAMAISAILISEAGMRFSAYYQTQVVDTRAPSQSTKSPLLVPPVSLQASCLPAFSIAQHTAPSFLLSAVELRAVGNFASETEINKNRR